MLLHIVHETVYSYDTPPDHIIQVLRLTPRGHEGQYVSRWRLEIDAECRLVHDEDPFGNITHAFTVEKPRRSMRVVAEGDIETEDTNGIIASAVDRLPHDFFLRSTTLTELDLPLRGFAADFASAARDEPLSALHRLMEALHSHMRFDTAATNAATSAREAFAAGHGVCQDFAQIFVAVSRHLGIPARFVGGYLLRKERPEDQEAGHAWAEAYVKGIGWIGFDAANCLCPTEAYVRVAAGLDSLDATPVRGVRRGGGNEAMSVHVSVTPAQPRVNKMPQQPMMQQSQTQHSS